ncbi:hypothetical protein A2708_02665 [Candidatus Saccharibacteria bacterium RIFCSPHIGHO2_01_FULL_49_21]|nr:MAG: hypothetical protein A2708_02665 [Candidatus Saccharibacteria bacterium RIFCSPHIGHO2_01_FULL_49_21]OGL37317.1 MAG: hypothetical protein A3B63_02070 [Candidatus Saccharibacteria bacterium RIFCSPLOWO2_01_FULL_49_22]
MDSMKGSDTVELNSGLEIPAIGFGTWNIHGREAVSSVGTALDAGYRLVDTARIYGNEREVGQAVGQSKVPRGDIFVTTKLWTSDQGHKNALSAFDESLERLELDYIDLYLIHWPGHDTQRRLDSWHALEEIHGSGRAKSIGVSNFTPEHLRELAKHSKITPAVNQIEFHPFIYDRQIPTLQYCKSRSIAVEAYSPLSMGKHINNSTISTVAEQVKRTNAQVMLRWAIQHSTVPIPKSAHAERIRENLGVFDFELTSKQMHALDALSGHDGKSTLPFYVRLLK